MYFSPIQVQPLETDRVHPPNKSFKSLSTQSVPAIRQFTTERSNTILSSYKHRQLTTRHQGNHSRLKKRTTTNATTTTPAIDEIVNQPTPNSIDDEDIRQEVKNMWQSIVTSAHVPFKPISKRSQHAIEDIQAIQQEQSLQDPTGYHRQVLPNIRPIPKSKFVYKGLAYKESQKLPGLGNGNSSEDEETGLQKPLIAYNLAQAYARYEINAARAKQNLQQQPPPSAATRTLPKEQSPFQQSHDIREIRKRIIRGTTLAYRPPTQSMPWTPGRVDHRSTLGSEVLLPVRSFITNNQSPSSLVYRTPPQTFITAHPTPNLSQIFQIPIADDNTNVSSL